ncbi:MAG: hypothetical protein IPL26_26865 [Leptospiraceae bacterium]|nr:hypothetical protein [Leptospiraceae bacterium]
MKTFTVLFLLIANSVLADMIILKNGQVLIGRYLSEDDRKVKFQTFNEVKSISKSEITSFELGYSGVPVCYQFQNKWTKVCGDVIHLLDKNKMILGKGDGLLEKEELQLKDLKLISLTKSKKEDRFFYILRPGLNVTLKSNGELITGEIESVTSDTLSLKTTKNSLALKEADIEEISWKGAERMSFSFLRYTVPGLFQFQEGRRFKGLLIGFLFFGFIGGIGAEYSAAQNALNNDTDFIIINNSIYIGSNIFPNPEFEKHVRGMNYAIAGLTLVTLFHSYEVYSHVTSQGVKASIHMQVPSRNSQAFQTEFISQTQKSTGIEFRISYSF